MKYNRFHIKSPLISGKGQCSTNSRQAYELMVKLIIALQHINMINFIIPHQEVLQATCKSYFLRLNQNLPPINIVQIEKNFSEKVFAETFPKPTEVRLLQVKYNAVM